jgi:hypothetical protein
MDSEQAASGEQIYQGLRAQIRSLDPATAELQQGLAHRALWGALMETGYRCEYQESSPSATSTSQLAAW